MGTKTSKTRADKILERIKNHPILSFFVVVGTIIIAIGNFTYALQTIGDLLVFFNFIEHGVFFNSEKIERPLPFHDDAPEIRLKVLDYSSQKNASWPAKAVIDGRIETAWMSRPSSSIKEESLIFSTIHEALFDLSSMQICTASSKEQHATMAVRSVTLLGSQELKKPRILIPCGTYSLTSKQKCHYLHLSELPTLRVLVVQITENAGGNSVLLSEIKAYGKEHNVDSSPK